jgi:hypothetical protein
MSGFQDNMLFGSNALLFHREILVDPERDSGRSSRKFEEMPVLNCSQYRYNRAGRAVHQPY